MRKLLHEACGIAGKTLAAAVKLAKKLAHIALQAAAAAAGTVAGACWARRRAAPASRYRR